MSRDTLLKILDLARWAPSGDNTQPWRFEIIDDLHLAIHGHDTRQHVIYDFDGHASHMAHGALLETLRLAATRFGFRAEWNIAAGSSEHAPVYEVALHPQETQESPLVANIQTRTVQRRAMRSTPLRRDQKASLIEAAGPNYTLQFFESFNERLAVARLLWKNAYLRLTCPEAYRVHREVIEWNTRFSKDRIPDRAVGVDPVTARIMRSVMQSWERVDFFNRYLAGTLLPRLQLDFIPALACSAHILLKPKQRQNTLEDQLAAGVALQRLWLTATHLGLHLQPEMTPVIFRWYVQAGRKISGQDKINAGAAELAKQFEQLSSATTDESFAFFCRTGHSQPPTSRSLRKELGDLMWQ